MPRFVIIGGGFYGVSLALFLRSLSKEIVVVERESELMTQASYVNQSRVHTGFHYPRSFATAKRSMLLHQKFIRDFRPAIRDDFQMLYAVARNRSKVSATRFRAMFDQLGAPIRPATRDQLSMFSSDTIAEVYQCDEAAFDPVIIRDMLSSRLKEAGITVLLGQSAKEVLRGDDGRPQVEMSDGSKMRADFIFNATYARLNHLLPRGSRHVLPIKNELTEVALVTPPKELDGLGVTVLDGPFFSIMPFPAQNCYSLTHVRYTPQFAWRFTDKSIPDEATQVTPSSHWLQMVRDAERYLPCMAATQWQKSLFVTKSVLERNERDDGRPIFLQRDPTMPEFTSIMGAKIDNVYDLFSMLPVIEPSFRDAHTGWLFGNDSKTEAQRH